MYGFINKQLLTIKKNTIMNNQAKKAYSSKAAAKRAMENKAHYLHGNGTSGAISFGRIWYQDNVIYAESNYWVSSSLEDFLNDKREL